MQRKNDHTWRSSSKRVRIREKTEILLWHVAQCEYKNGRKEQEKLCGVKRETSTMKQSCRRLWRREQEVQTQHGKTQGQPKKGIVTPKSNYVLSIIWITSAEISQVVYPLHHHLNSLWKQRFLYVCHWNQYLLLNNFCFIPSTITYFLVSELGLLTVYNFLQKEKLTYFLLFRKKTLAFLSTLSM